MDALTLAALAALAVKVMTVVKSIGKDNNKAITQTATWVVGIGVVALGAHSGVTSDIVVFGAHRLGDLDFGSTVLAGMSLSSVGSFAYDVKSAVDNTDSAAEPALLPAPGAGQGV